jgi:hypothetical protein
VEEACCRAASIPWTHVVDRPITLPQQIASPDIRILKMHGSMDWLWVPPDVRWRDGSTFLCFEDGTRQANPETKQESLHRAQSLGQLTELFDSFHHEYRSALVELGLRKAIDELSVLGPIWALAGSHLQMCDEIVVVGFSFSPHDILIRFLCHGAARSRSTPPRVAVIDNCETNAKRVASVLQQLMGAEAIVRVQSAEIVDWSTPLT